MPGAIKRHCLGVIANGGLGRCVRSRARNTHQPGARGNIDNGASPTRAHGAYRVLAAEEHTVEIGVMHGLPVLQARMLRVVLDGALL